VYDFLLQLEEVGGCIPGGKVGPAGDDGGHPAEIVVKLGPMRFNYRGTVNFWPPAKIPGWGVLVLLSPALMLFNELIQKSRASPALDP
jgi:hypothetical protein